jgi:hypothetical protein
LGKRLELSFQVNQAENVFWKRYFKGIRSKEEKILQKNLPEPMKMVSEYLKFPKILKVF